jgi:hypothetical protein
MYSFRVKDCLRGIERDEKNKINKGKTKVGKGKVERREDCF